MLPRDEAARLIQKAAGPGRGDIRPENPLSNDDLDRCHTLLTILITPVAR
jgi:hypothetical protein